MAGDIERDGKGPRKPIDPSWQPPKEVTVVPPGKAHTDFDDEVGSQRRVRWMTQAMVMPALVGFLFGFGYLLGYEVGELARNPGEAAPRTAFTVVLIAIPAWFMLRGKIGARRRWVNALLLIGLLALAGTLGFRSASEPAAPELRE